VKNCRCEGTKFELPAHEVRCRNKATTTRKDWRFGDAKKGEPTFVDVVVHLCESCAYDYDDRVAEGQVEANAS